VEASALQAPAGVARSRISIGSPLLRLRSDEQLVALFRSGNDDAFRVIHDRYRQRLFAYTRQMLPGSRQDAEDALQDVFVRAYGSLRSTDRELALRAWLYRVAHNRCIDELRRPAPPGPELIELVRAPVHDPIAEAEQRESLRRLVEDVRRLPDQQRSALLMRELSGMSYNELADALGVSVPAVKSLLVRARVTLAAAREARDTACSEIRDELILAHDRRVRPNAIARRHLRDCAGCREFRAEMRSVSRQLAALVPPLGPVALIGSLLGFGGATSGGMAAGGSAAAGSGAAASGSAAAAGTGAFATGGILAAGASHVATLLAAAVVTATGAVAIEHTTASSPPRPRQHHSYKPVPKPIAPTKSGTAPATTSSSLAVSKPATQPQSPAQPTTVPASPQPAESAQPSAAPPSRAPAVVRVSAAADTSQLPADTGANLPLDGTGSSTGADSGASTGAGNSSSSVESTPTDSQTPSTADPASSSTNDPSSQSTPAGQVNGGLVPQGSAPSIHPSVTSSSTGASGNAATPGSTATGAISGH
jgi:RNA polymerase sigma factor (sigma-70 family)